MKNLLLLLLVCFPIILDAQGNCEGSFTPYYLNSNHIRASFFPRGNKFYGEKDGLQVPYPSELNLKTITASSIWIAGFDDAQNLKISTETFPSVTQTDFSVGPLSSIGLRYDSLCGKFDHAWTVYAEDILAHRADFQSDGKIDDTIPSIFGWPATGNKYFSRFNGFELPDHSGGWADFFDYNGNGIYEPEHGDFPIVYLEGHEYIPDQILWMVFNDSDSTNSPNQRPLLFEIQLTAFAFHCQDNEMLNNTIFNSYKIFNRAVLAADSLFFGTWTDYDLGCPYDDFIGSDSARSTEYVYNDDEMDGDSNHYCILGPLSYPGVAPVQSMTYLYPPMSSFISYSNQVNNPLQSYRLLNGMWEDGKAIKPEGDGHNTTSGLSPTKFLYNGDPRDTVSWAALNVFNEGSDVISLSAVSLGRMNPGQARKVELAYMFHHDPKGGFLDQITKMFTNVDSLINSFWFLNFICSQYPVCQGKDCVWPGDFDHNGIADHRDLLQLGAEKDLSGPERDGFNSWRGHDSEDWNIDIAGINAKHGDGDGNGIINLEDLKLNTDYFRFTNRFYQKEEVFPEGPELVISSSPMSADGSIKNILVKAGIYLENILGLAYELDYDTTLYTHQQLRIAYCPADSNIVCFGSFEYNPEDPGFVVSPAYAFVMTDHQPLQIEAGYHFELSTGGLRLKPHISVADIPDTITIRLKNLTAIDPNGNDLHIGSNTLKIPNYLITGTKDPATTESSVFIYPNPADQSISIETDLDSDILIFNPQGLVMKKINQSDIHQPIDISALSPGLYILQMLETGKAYKFVRQ